LIRRDEGLALLFAPPFDKTTHDPGYINLETAVSALM
jgi:cyclic beta-1,2-glucan synthetase